MSRPSRAAPASRNDLAVLTVVRAATRPLSAYDILATMRPDRPRIAPATVYRALHRLAASGAVFRIESLNAWFSSPATGQQDCGVVAIYDDCGVIGRYAAPDALAAIGGALAGSRFQPLHPTIEVHGRCGACDEARA